MSAQKRFNLALACKILACMFSFLMIFGGSHPPVVAQARNGQMWITSSEDAVQDENIVQINKHLEHTDAVLEHEETRVQELDSQLSEMQGEERIAFIVLTALTGGSAFLQRKKAQAE